MSGCLKRVVWRDQVPPRVFFLGGRASDAAATAQNGVREGRNPSHSPLFKQALRQPSVIESAGGSICAATLRVDERDFDSAARVC